MKSSGIVLSISRAAAAALACACLAAYARGAGITYSGEAAAINFGDFHEPVSTTIILADTGALSSSGGFLEAKQGAYNFYNGVVELSSASSACFGGLGVAMAGSEIANFQVQLAGSTGQIYTLTADAISVDTVAVDVGGTVAVKGCTRFVNLKLNGQPITVTGQANQVITFDVWTVTLNQQTTAETTTSGSISTTAMYITMPGCLQGYVCPCNVSLTIPAASPGCGNSPSCNNSGCQDQGSGGQRDCGTVCDAYLAQCDQIRPHCE